MLVWISVLLLLCAAGAGLLLHGTVWEVFCEAENEEAIPSLMASLRPEQLRKERNLARWYNFSIRQEKSNSSLLGAYREIMDFGAGKMGYLSYPGLKLLQPIVHDVENGENAAVHLFGSPLPVGGVGNCPILQCRAGEGEPAEGELFHIYILDTVLTYQVVSIGEIPEITGDEDLCVLQLMCGEERRYITGIRGGSLP